MLPELSEEAEVGLAQTKGELSSVNQHLNEIGEAGGTHYIEHPNDFSSLQDAQLTRVDYIMP